MARCKRKRCGFDESHAIHKLPYLVGYHPFHPEDAVPAPKCAWPFSGECPTNNECIAANMCLRNLSQYRPDAQEPQRPLEPHLPGCPRFAGAPGECDCDTNEHRYVQDSIELESSEPALSAQEWLSKRIKDGVFSYSRSELATILEA